jgi:hypothetical protein
MHKNILSDNRVSFTTKYLTIYMVVNSFLIIFNNFIPHIIIYFFNVLFFVFNKNKYVFLFFSNYLMFFFFVIYCTLKSKI